MSDDYVDDDFDVADYPSLVAGVRFTKSLPLLPWFAHTGRPLERELCEDAAMYATALGFPDAGAVLGEWAEAAAIAADPDLASREREAELVRALADEAAATVGADNVQAALNDAGAAIGRIVPDRVRERLAALGALDGDTEALVAAAADAAYGACQGGLLVVLAVAEEDHVFARKFRLFERGRWPIGIIGHTLLLL